MKTLMVQIRQPNGALGPLEPAFPEVVHIDETVLMLLEAVAGQQEQIMIMQTEIEQLKGGGE